MVRKSKSSSTKRRRCQAHFPSSSWRPLTYPSSASRKEPASSLTDTRATWPPQTLPSWRWVTSCQAPRADLRRWLLPESSVSGLEQRVSAAAGRGGVGRGGWWWWCWWGGWCLHTAPSSALRPRPRPSDVCVSSLMKKFWYLGETLLSAEQTVPSAPVQSHRPTHLPSIHQASGCTLPAPSGATGRLDNHEDPKSEAKSLHLTSLPDKDINSPT